MNPRRRPTKSVSVDLRQGQFIVASFSKTPPGFWVVNEHFAMVEETVGDETLGQQVLAALEASNQTLLDVPPKPTMPVMAELGLRTYSQYVKGTLSVLVALEDDVLEITPTRNEGPREGFAHLNEKRRVVANLRSAEALGAAVREAMSQAE